MAAHLTTTLSTHDYDSIDDLRHHGIPLYIKDSYFSRRLFKTRFKKVYEEIETNKWFWEKDDDILRHLEANHAVFAKIDAIQRVLKKHCNLTVKTLEPMGLRQTGFAMRKDHPMMENVSRQIIKYLADGSIMDIIADYAEAKCPAKKPWNALPRADLPKMKGLL